jgi:extracellular elastinolytic metalloproteinase
MYWNLVDAHGYSSNWYDSSQTHGNIVALKLVMDALKIQPCDPTFVTARDAIISLAGKDTCLVWKAFAKRGLGVHATEDFVEDFNVPPKC